MPRKLTNKFNLPETLVKAVQYDTHRLAGTISVTELIDAPRIRLLKKTNTYEVDVSDSLAALMGTALHHILERANIDSVRKRAFILTAETIMSAGESLAKTDAEKGKKLQAAANYVFSLIPALFPEVKEKYIFEKTLRLDLIGGHTLSGTFDLYDKETGILYDYKSCSTFSYTNMATREKWKQQANIYAYMLHLEGYPINGIRIVAMFKNWNPHQLNNNKDYPARNIMEINIPLGNPTQTETPWYEHVENFITKRIKLHIQAEEGNIPDCTGVDRWAVADTFAVKTPKNKRAIKLFDSKEFAEGYIQENQHKFAELNRLFIETRPGGSTRCGTQYCIVSDFCSQWKKEQEIRIKEA